MAALSSSRIYDLVDRYLFRSRDAPSSAFESRPHFKALRDLTALTSNSEGADEAWLRRIELRGASAVINYLETAAFREAGRSSLALLVDQRCGLICTLPLGENAPARSPACISAILRRAVECQAAGVVLATNDADGTIGRSPEARDLTLTLYRKSHAIGLYLLDHFVLIHGIWKRMMSINPADQI